MVDPIIIGLDAAFTIFSVIALVYMYMDMKKHKEDTIAAWHAGGWQKKAKIGVSEFFLSILDVFGIGCYAPTYATWKIFHVCRDVLFPGTLLVCMTTQTLVESIYCMTAIDIDPITALTCVITASIGAFFGAGFFAKFNLKKMRFALGIALLVVAVVLVLGILGLLNFGGDAIGVDGWKLVVLNIITFILGALMTIGIGCYAPTLAVVSLMGMDPSVSWPIMIGMCGVLCPVAGIRYIRESIDSPVPVYDRNIAITYNACGWIGSIVAMIALTYGLFSLPLATIKIFVVIVIVFTACLFIYDGVKDTTDKVAEREDAEMAAFEGKSE